MLAMAIQTDPTIAMLLPGSSSNTSLLDLSNVNLVAIKDVVNCVEFSVIALSDVLNFNTPALFMETTTALLLGSLELTSLQLLPTTQTTGSSTAVQHTISQLISTTCHFISHTMVARK